jgi:hypothetical protein
MRTFVNAPYPVRVTAKYDPALSRWLWLVKIVLVIPHAIVLAFLWIGAIFATLAAGFAILVTGRYPRSLFDFNVGVLRWTWRVSFYATSAFGTDRYPPFRLAADPDYPAELDVTYPEHLSRGLVLVKWWLLAIPQYLVVAFFSGGWGPMQGGLISLLAVIAAVALLVTGRYPRSLFDLVVGLNRWCLRVVAYAALMTDDYPPFRLDQGEAEPDGRAVPVSIRKPLPHVPGPAPA